MRSNEAIVETGQSLVRWGALEPVITVAATDPRAEMSEHALVLASRNAFPIVAQQKSRKDNLGLLAGAAIALVLGCITFVSLSSGRTASTAPVATPSLPNEPTQAPRAPALPMAPPLPQGVAAPHPTTAPTPIAPPIGVNMQQMPRPASPVMVYDGSAGAEGGRAIADASASSQTPEMLALGPDGSGSPDADPGAARATKISDPSHTVVQGTLIPAVLETAINSDVPGYVRAVVSADVRSFDGSQVLVPRSSRLIGEYKTGLAAGQRRAYLIWTRLLRPDGVSVQLASPSIDFSGESGIGGRVNSHFLQRFGSAILLSVLGGASALASGGATVVVAGGQGAASAATQHDDAHPPTIRVSPGEPIRVFTAHDLIFSPIDRKGA
jgi:type IV secretion system protein VirB10